MRPGSHSPFFASTLYEVETDVHGMALNVTSLWKLPEDPFRNLDFDENGQKTVVEACNVATSMLEYYLYRLDECYKGGWWRVGVLAKTM